MRGIGKTIKRRRQEAKTDYGSRLVMLKSGKPRLVIRKTNKQIIMQIVVSELAQDKIISGFSSNALLEQGWPKELKGSLKGLAAAYVTGRILAGKVKGKISEAILDLGMQRNIKKSRIYSAVKGAIDGGLKVKVSEDVLPSLDEIKKRSNEKVQKVFDKLKDK
jgi:large subunit ribosomal protein L18